MNQLNRRTVKLESAEGQEVTHILINPTETDAQIVERITRETGAPPKSMMVLRLWDEVAKS